MYILATDFFGNMTGDALLYSRNGPTMSSYFQDIHHDIDAMFLHLLWCKEGAMGRPRLQASITLISCEVTSRSTR
jgi:hypothetical protein